MTNTPHLGIALIEQSQAQKEITVNMGLARIDALLNTGAKDKDVALPPSSPAAGDVYIVAPGAAGEWAGKAGSVAYYEQGWKFLAPNEGLTLWVCDEDCLYTYSGTGWAQSGGGRRSLYLPASALRPAVASGCTPLAAVALGTGLPDSVSLDFDPATEEYAQFSLTMPKSWDRSALSANFDWSRGAASGAYGAVWAVQAASVADGGSMASGFGLAQAVSDSASNANALYRTGATAPFMPSGVLTGQDTLFFRVFRKSADPADSLSADARLHGLTLFYAASAGSEA